jgi:hypothetical protein
MRKPRRSAAAATQFPRRTGPAQAAGGRSLRGATPRPPATGLYGSTVPIRRLGVVAVTAAALLLATAAQAIPMGAYGNTARFDRLTGQKTKSGLVFLGWDQGRTYGSPYSTFLANLRERPHVAIHPEGRDRKFTPSAIALGRGDAHLIGWRRLRHRYEAAESRGLPALHRPAVALTQRQR